MLDKSDTQDTNKPDPNSGTGVAVDSRGTPTGRAKPVAKSTSLLMDDDAPSTQVTGQQSVSVVSFQDAQYLDNRGLLYKTGDTNKPAPRYNDYRLLRKHPTAWLARKLALAPILSSDWNVEERENAPDKARDFIESEVMKLRLSYLLSAGNGNLDFGWQGFEKVCSRRKVGNFKGQVGIDELKPLLQDITTILIDVRTGSFEGYAQWYTRGYWSGLYAQQPTAEQYGDTALPRQVVLTRRDAMHTVFNIEGTQWYGWPDLEIARESINQWTVANDAAARYDRKLAGSHWVVYYPSGKSELGDPPVMTDNFEIASRIIRSLEASGAVAVPSTIGAMMGELSKDAPNAWRVELLTDSASAQAAFVDRLKYLDALIVRAFGLPERAVLEGQFGTKAEAEAHADFAISNIELRHKQLCIWLNKQLVNQLLLTNYGPEFVDTVYVEPQPLVDVQRSALMQIYMSFLANPENAAVEYMSMDMEHFRDRLGVPSNPNAPSNVDLLGQIKQEQADIDRETAKITAQAVAESKGIPQKGGSAPPFGADKKAAKAADKAEDTGDELSLEFDEDKHVRDEKGRFAIKGSVGAMYGVLKTGDVHAAEGWGTEGKRSYGGVVSDQHGRILLRKPTNNFGGYHWTFAKGGPDAGEHPLDAALREVREETGVNAQITGQLPGAFGGTTGVTNMFTMRANSSDKHETGVPFEVSVDGETSHMVWATPEQAEKFIAETTSVTGKARDLAILKAARESIKANALHLPNAKGAEKPEQVTKAATSTPEKPASKKSDWPSDPHALKVVEKLGGSTGAEKVRDAHGNVYARKTGVDPEHIRNENAALQAYKAAGVAVPRSRLYETDKGPVQLTRWVEGKKLSDVQPGTEEHAAVMSQLQRGYAADAVLANWDVAGMYNDNVLVTPKGQAVRIDVGGAMSKKATGGDKPYSPDEVPEFTTLRDKNVNKNTTAIFGPMTKGQRVASAMQLVERTDEILAALPEKYRAVVEARLRHVSKYVEQTKKDLGIE